MNKVTVKNAVVGKEYVIFHAGNVCKAAWDTNPVHPCRATVTKVGRTKIQTNCDLSVSENSKFALVEIDEAKEIYRKQFTNVLASGYVTQEYVDALVASL